MALYSSDRIRKRLQRQFQDALNDLPSEEIPLVGLPSLPSLSEDALLRSSGFWRGRGARDNPGDAHGLDEKLETLRQSLVESDEKNRILEYDLQKTRQESEQARQRIDELLEKIAAAERQMEILQQTVQEREAEKAALQESLKEKNHALATQNASVSFLEDQNAELKTKLDTPDQEPFAQETKKRLAEQTEFVKEKSERVRELETELADKERFWKETHDSTERIRKSLLKKETESRLLTESVNRLSKQNKELLIKIRQFSETSPTRELPPAAAAPVLNEQDTQLQERLQSLELALESRDTMIQAQEKELADRNQTQEKLRVEIAGLREQTRNHDKTVRQVQELVSQKESVGRALEEKEQILRQWKDHVEALRQENKDLKARLTDVHGSPAPVTGEAAAQLREEFVKKERDWQEKIQEREGRLAAAEKSRVELDAKAKMIGADLERSRQSCDELRSKNEELETQVRLLVLNSESIERMEKNLRETFRLIPTFPAVVPPSLPPKNKTQPQPAGFWARLMAWWKAPLLRFGGRKTTSSMGSFPGAPPGTRRLNEMRSHRQGR